MKKYRLAAGLSADKLVEKIRGQFPDTGVSRQVIFNIEKGRREIRLDELCEISMALDIKPTALICDYSKPFRRIRSGVFDNFLPIEVTNFFYTETFDEDSLDSNESPDHTDNMILTYATQVMYALDSFERAYAREDFPTCSFAVEDAKANIKALQKLDIDIPDGYMQRFSDCTALLSNLPKEYKEMGKRWNTIRFRPRRRPSHEKEHEGIRIG